MKYNLSTLAIVTAAVLGFGASAKADHNDSHRWEQGSQRDFKSSYGVNDQRQENRGFFARIFGLPGRTARTIVHSPAIVGESLAGRREIVSDRGRFFASSDRVRDDRPWLYDRTGRIVRGTDRVIGNVANSGQSFVIRGGRTVVHSPEIIGESLSGRRTIIDQHGHVLSRNERFNDRSAEPDMAQREDRSQNLYAGTW